MYDDLIKRLKSEADFPYNDNRNLLREAADAIEDLSKPRWIPVTERLPEVDEEVLVYLWGGKIPYIAWIDREAVWETNDFYIDVEDMPKAWMPLPQPPKEVDT